MPNFAASLQDGSGNIAITSSSGTMTINDYSNYIASTEEGHLKVDFEDYKRIIVEDPDGSDYTYSTLSGGDETILTPDNYSTTPIQTTYQYSIDGRYDITLEAVPTWETGLDPEWDLSNTGISGVTIVYSVSAVTSSCIYVCGTSGKIYKSTDDASNWTSQTSGTSETLRKIRFMSTTVGVCVGDNDTVLLTTDGGATWQDKNTGTGYVWRGCYIVDSSTWWVCGDFGANAYVYKTEDGGASYTQKYTATGDFYDIVLIGSKGFVAGGNGSNDAIWTSSDAGENWASSYVGSRSYFHFIHAIDANTAYAGGNNTGAGQIVKTTTGGSSWNTIAFSLGGSNSGGLRDAYFLDANRGWFVGGYIVATGVIYGTIDGGTTVTEEYNSGTYSTIFGINGVDDENVYAVGLNNGAFKYDGNYTYYQEDECVYYDGSLYQALGENHNQTPATATTYWSSILASNLPEKYRVTESVIIVDNSEDCWAKSVYQECCTELDIGCNDEGICEDEKFVNAVKVDLCLACADIQVDNLEYDKANVLINRIKDICDCCTD